MESKVSKPYGIGNHSLVDSLRESIVAHEGTGMAVHISRSSFGTGTKELADRAGFKYDRDML